MLGADVIAMGEADRISAFIKIDNNAKCMQVQNDWCTINFEERVVIAF